MVANRFRPVGLPRFTQDRTERGKKMYVSNDNPVDPIELAEAVREVAKEQPTQWNRMPNHFDAKGQPQCIVGHALDRLGLTTIFNSVVSIVPHSWERDADQELAFRWLMTVQSQADMGVDKSYGDPYYRNPWARAVQAADQQALDLAVETL
ncbi:hypothetical protein SEA_KEELAN_65 [Gordonia phage Keelan]|nr:hypothetical protein SEA_KEELAN_65 [Gordonia phage Keelan]